MILPNMDTIEKVTRLRHFFKGGGALLGGLPVFIIL